MKHLKVLAKLVPPDFNYVDMTIIDRVDHYDDFGGNRKKEENHLYFTKKCCFIGTDTTRFDGVNPSDKLLDIYIGPKGTTGTIPIEHWPAVKEAILQYNRWGRRKK